MELELYAPVPDGYELVGFRTPKESEVYINLFGEPVISPAAFEVSRCRMIVRKIKPRIKRSFRVDVLDETERTLNAGESGIYSNSVIVSCTTEKSILPYTPCIVTELPVENE